MGGVSFRVAVKWLSLIRWLAAVAAVCSSAATRATDAAPVLTQAFRSSAEGLGVHCPSSWELATGVKTVVTNPALCLAVAPGGNSQVEVKVVEYLPPLLKRSNLAFYQPRPRRFQLAKLRWGDTDWTTGKLLSF